jgi:large-conductance mechanosensitive channel
MEVTKNHEQKCFLRMHAKSIERVKKILYILLAILLFTFPYNVATASAGPDIVYNGGYMQQFISPDSDKTFVYVFVALFSIVNADMSIQQPHDGFSYTGINWYVKYPGTDQWIPVYNRDEGQGEHGTTISIEIPQEVLNGGTIGVASSFTLNGKIVKITKNFDISYLLNHRNGNNKPIDSAKMHELEKKYQQIDQVYAKFIYNVVNFILLAGIIAVPFLVFRRRLKEESEKDVQENAEDNKKN